MNSTERVEHVAKALFEARYVDCPERNWGEPVKDANAYTQRTHELAKDKCRLEAKEFLALYDATLLCNAQEAF